MSVHSRPDRIRGTAKPVEKAAQDLRRNLTDAESHLWTALRNKQLMGLRFRCQHPVGQFILDFYCPAIKLVIEVDGNSHDMQLDYDAARTQTLQEHGYQVLRFSNQAVLENLEEVLGAIGDAAKLRLETRGIMSRTAP